MALALLLRQMRRELVLGNGIVDVNFSGGVDGCGVLFFVRSIQIDIRARGTLKFLFQL
jgi:hypothetical protein